MIFCRIFLQNIDMTFNTWDKNTGNFATSASKPIIHILKSLFSIFLNFSGKDILDIQFIDFSWCADVPVFHTSKTP